jgi:hypothetical protein
MTTPRWLPLRSTAHTSWRAVGMFVFTLVAALTHLREARADSCQASHNRVVTELENITLTGVIRRRRAVTNIPDRGRRVTITDVFILAHPICMAHVRDPSSGTVTDYENVRELEMLPPGRLRVGVSVTLAGSIARGSSDLRDVFFFEPSSHHLEVLRRSTSSVRH